MSIGAWEKIWICMEVSELSRFNRVLYFGVNGGFIAMENLAPAQPDLSGNREKKLEGLVGSTDARIHDFEFIWSCGVSCREKFPFT